TAASASTAFWAGLAATRARARTPSATRSAPSASREERRSARMDRSFLLTQRPGIPRGVHGEELADDRDGDLLGTLRAQVQSDRREEPLARFRADLSEDLAPALPRAEQPDVGDAGVAQPARPLPIVRERVHLDDREGVGTERKAVGARLGPPGVEAHVLR